MNLLHLSEDGTLQLSGPVVFHCGCGGVVPKIRSRLQISGVPQVPLIMTSNNKKAKNYIRQIGLAARVPSLSRSSHAVLFNPRSGRFIDLIKAPQNSSVYENIYSVATE